MERGPGGQAGGGEGRRGVAGRGDGEGLAGLEGLEQGGGGAGDGRRGVDRERGDVGGHAGGRGGVGGDDRVVARVGGGDAGEGQGGGGFSRERGRALEPLERRCRRAGDGGGEGDVRPGVDRLRDGMGVEKRRGVGADDGDPAGDAALVGAGRGVQGVVGRDGERLESGGGGRAGDGDLEAVYPKAARDCGAADHGEAGGKGAGDLPGFGGGGGAGDVEGDAEGGVGVAARVEGGVNRPAGRGDGGRRDDGGVERGGAGDGVDRAEGGERHGGLEQFTGLETKAGRRAGEQAQHGRALQEKQEHDGGRVQPAEPVKQGVQIHREKRGIV